jgi:hypothetical protein
MDTVDVIKLLIRKENSHGFFFSKISSNPVCEFFLFDLLIIGKWWFDYFFYRNIALDRFSIFAEHFFRRYRAPSIVFELILFFRRKRCFTFWIVTFVLTKREQPDGLDNVIELGESYVSHHIFIPNSGSSSLLRSPDGRKKTSCSEWSS